MGDASDSLLQVTAANDPINQVLAAFENDQLGIVAAADQIMEHLSAKGFVTDMKLDPRMVGFDPANRGGEGCHAQTVFELAREIVEVGFSWPETAHACCVEVRPGDEEVEKFNVTLCLDSGLAPVTPGSIRYGSLSCGHTNFVLRTLKAEMPSDDIMLSENGRFSVQKITRRDAEYGSAIAHGLKWRVLSWKVRVMYPAVLSLIQSARNINSTIARKESEMSGLLRLHAASAAAMKDNRPVNWAAIKKNISRSRPPYLEIVNDLIAFLITKSGGVSGQHLKFLHAFWCSCVPAKRYGVPGPLYVALAEFPHHFLAYAVLEASFLCPPENVKGTVCVWASPSEITALAKAGGETAARLRAAEQVLVQARTLLAEAGISGQLWESNKLVGCLGKLDVSMARFVLGKQEMAKNKFRTPLEVAGLFMNALAEAYPNMDLAPFKTAWAITCEAPSEQKGGTTAAEMPLYDLDKEGRVIDPLAELRRKGFDVGTAVMKKADVDLEASGQAKLYRISGVVRDAANPGVTVVPFAFEEAASKTSGVAGRCFLPVQEFFEEYELRDPKSHVERHPAWPAGRASSTEAVQVLTAKGNVLHALGALVLLTKPLFDPTHVTIFTRPTRRVVVNKPFGIGELVLIPESLNVKSVPVGEPFEDKLAVKVSAARCPPKFSLYIMPTATNDVVAPLWCVAATEDEAKANLVWVESSLGSCSFASFFGSVTPELPTGERRRVRSKTSGEAVEGEPVVDTVVSIPILTNSQPLEEGEELLLFRRRSPKVVKDPPAITVSQLAKKAKH